MIHEFQIDIRARSLYTSLPKQAAFFPRHDRVIERPVLALGDICGPLLCLPGRYFTLEQTRTCCVAFKKHPHPIFAD